MDRLLDVAKALADESRLRAIHALDGDELCLCQLVDLLGLAPSTVSRHLDLLRRAGLVELRKQGKWHWFRLAGDDAPPEAADALTWVRRSLADDPAAANDRARLCCVLEKDLDELTACYG